MNRCYLRDLCVPVALFTAVVQSMATMPGTGRYPEAVLMRIGGHQPFSPVAPDARHRFTLKLLSDAATGRYFGAAAKLQVDTLGEKLFLVDTAARGLLLKCKSIPTENVIKAPEWIRPGPGIQTGVFRIYPKISASSFAMTAAVAELFSVRGLPWVDGILSTEILDSWVVRLDFRNKQMLLLPFPDYVAQPLREWPARLDLNYWIVTAQVGKKPAHLLLDSGSGYTFLSERWLQTNLSRATAGRRRRVSKARPFVGLGTYEIGIPGIDPIRGTVMEAEDARIPRTPGSQIDGVLGFDILHDLAVDLDYRAQKVYLLPRK
jgi:hypothetical protein